MWNPQFGGSAFEQNDEDKIVRFLKQRLNISFTLYQFSQIAGAELIELLNTVIHAVDETQPEKIGTEEPDATYDRISEFLRIMKYPFPVAPEEWDKRLSKVDPTLIHPVLVFLLQNFEELQKQAYVAKFTEDVQIPDEIQVDPMVAELLSNRAQLKEQFMEQLKELEEIGESSGDLKSTITDLENDKARIAGRISQYKRQMANVPNFDELLKITARNREASEKEAALAQQLEQLQEENRLLEHRQKVAMERQKNHRATLESQLRQLKEEIASLKNPGDNVDKNVAMMQNQVMSARQRLSKRQDVLKATQERKESIEKELQEKQTKEIITIPNQKEYNEYVASLQVKNKNFKEMKAVVTKLRSEIVQLTRTKEIVQQQSEAVAKELDATERARGVTGHREAREQLDKVSASKAILDEMKGKTLEEMTTYSQEIQRQIMARKKELEPITLALHKKGEEKMKVEDKFLKAKTRYLKAVSEYDSVCLALDEECKNLRHSLAAQQTKYFTVASYTETQNRAIQRAEAERSALESGKPVSPGMKTYSRYFQHEAHRIKKENKELSQQKAQVGQQTESHLKQQEMFVNLRRLLQVRKDTMDAVRERKRREDAEAEREAMMKTENIVF